MKAALTLAILFATCIVLAGVEGIWMGKVVNLSGAKDKKALAPDMSLNLQPGGKFTLTSQMPSNVTMVSTGVWKKVPGGISLTVKKINDKPAGEAGKARTLQLSKDGKTLSLVTVPVKLSNGKMSPKTKLVFTKVDG